MAFEAKTDFKRSLRGSTCKGPRPDVAQSRSPRGEGCGACTSVGWEGRAAQAPGPRRLLHPRITKGSLFPEAIYFQR